jgi:hypothetical protein
MMPTRAIAYHPRVARQKLRMYFLNEAADGITSKNGIRCTNCGLTFPVVFPIRDELGNTAYHKRLKQLISDNCKNGNHKDEYIIDDLR